MNAWMTHWRFRFLMGRRIGFVVKASKLSRTTLCSSHVRIERDNIYTPGGCYIGPGVPWAFRLFFHDLIVLLDDWPELEMRAKAALRSYDERRRDNATRIQKIVRDAELPSSESVLLRPAGNPEGDAERLGRAI